MLKQEILFQDFEDISQACRETENDLKLQNDLTPDSYLRIRYEDLVADPVEHLNRIFAFLGESRLSESEEDRVAAHSNSDLEVKGQRKYFFSTFRSGDFDPYAWKHELDEDVWMRINEDCQRVIASLKYA